MANYFAELNENNVVVRVIVADENFIKSGILGDPKNWIETFMDGSQRKNYAGLGYTYDKNRDAFIGPTIFKSWVLDENNCKWE